MKKKIAQKTINEIINLYTIEKMGSTLISRKLNISRSTILQLLKKMNVPIENSGQRWKGGKSESDKRYYNKNKTSISIKYKKWSVKNKDKLKKYHKTWRDNNEKYRKYKNDYEKNKKKNDPIYKLNSYLRTAIYSSLTEKNIKKDKKTSNILNFTINELKSHLELQFTNGMSWENYGEWHVDHILPISHFNYKSIDSEEFKECWSLSNLRPLWSSENLSKNNKIISHQYRIRLEKSKEEQKNIQFDLNKVELKNSTVRIIDRKSCEKIINEYEWLGYLPKYCNFYFGIFFKIDENEYLGGVIALQPEYGDNLGIWDKYGFSNKIIQLSRGVCLWWTPKNSASYMISRVINHLKSHTEYEIITATVDSQAGEIGTIYQSLSWYYVGCMSGNLTKTGKERIRYGYKINGKLYNQRHIRSMIGSANKENVLKHFPSVEIVNLGRKRRYFKFIKNKKKHLKSIKSILKEYPKR